MKKEILTQIAALSTAAFGLVAALAWNGAIQAIFKEIFGTADSIKAMSPVKSFCSNDCDAKSSCALPEGSYCGGAYTLPKATCLKCDAANNPIISTC